MKIINVESKNDWPTSASSESSAEALAQQARNVERAIRKETRRLRVLKIGRPWLQEEAVLVDSDSQESRKADTMPSEKPSSPPSEKSSSPPEKTSASLPTQTHTPFDDGRERHWPNIDRMCPHPHTALKVTGNQAWGEGDHEYVWDDEAAKKTQISLGLKFGHDLAATKRNTKARNWNSTRLSFKQSMWSELHISENEVLYLCWPTHSRKIQAKARRERVRLLLLTPAWEGATDKHTKVVGEAPSKQFSPPQPAHTMIYMDYSEYVPTPKPHRTITSSFYGEVIYHAMTAAEVSAAYREEYFVEELVWRGLLHPDWPTRRCCSHLRDEKAEAHMWRHVAKSRRKSIYKIIELSKFLHGLEPLEVEICLLAFQQGVHQLYFGPTHLGKVEKDNQAFRRNSAGRVQVLAKELRHGRFVVFKNLPARNLKKMPWGLVPKTDGTYRRTVNDGYGEAAINKYIPRLRVQLDPLEKVIEVIVRVCKAAKESMAIFKNDFWAAFRNMLVRVQDLHTNAGCSTVKDLLAAYREADTPPPPWLQERRPEELVYYIDANNNNGRRSCPALWCLFSRLFLRALRRQLDRDVPRPGPFQAASTLLNFVDDNILINTIPAINRMSAIISSICTKTLSEDGHHKAVGPTLCTRVLGPELDVSRSTEGVIQATVPAQKKESCAAQWHEVLQHEGMSLKGIQSLAGKMQWHSVIAPPLLRVMPKLYNWLTTVSRIVRRQSRHQDVLMKIPRGQRRFVLQLSRWYPTLLKNWKATDIMRTPPAGTPGRSFQIFCDANGGKLGDEYVNGGIGVYAPDVGFVGSAPLPKLAIALAMRDKTTSSTFLEWLGVAAAVRGLAKTGFLQGAAVKIRVDNKPVDQGHSNTSTSWLHFPFLLMITAEATCHSATISIEWIKRSENAQADALGRGATAHTSMKRLPLNVSLVLSECKTILCRHPGVSGDKENHC